MPRKQCPDTQYQWLRITDFPGGHRIFREERNGRYSVCDGSGRYPHLTDDGVLWIDTNRPVTCTTTAKPMWGLPVITEDGTNKGTVVPEAEARWAIEKLGMHIMVGGSIFGRLDLPRIPFKQGVGDVSTHHITLQDSLTLDRGDVPDQIGNFEYGHMVLTHPRCDEKRTTRLRQFGMSEAYIRLMHCAYAQGYYYLMIDQDGPVVDDLDKFDW